MATEALKRYSVEEYLALERAAETKSEFYDGEIFAMAGASPTHVLIASGFIAALHNALKGRGCRVYTSDLRVKVPTGLYTYPDVTVVCGEPRFEGDKRDILLNPTLIVEVLSPSTEAYDRGKKFEHYRQLPSLRAYILASQDRKAIEHFARQDDGTWQFTAVREGRLTIPSLNVAIAVDDVYEHVQFPDTDEALGSQ